MPLVGRKFWLTVIVWLINSAIDFFLLYTFETFFPKLQHPVIQFDLALQSKETSHILSSTE